jgi:hypothetical protein
MDSAASTCVPRCYSANLAAVFAISPTTARRRERQPKVCVVELPTKETGMKAGECTRRVMVSLGWSVCCLSKFA